MWLGVVLGLLAVVALVPRRTRVPVLICWLVALAAAVVSGLLSHVTLDLPSVTTRPSLGLFVVILQGTSVVAVVLGADAYLRRLDDAPPVVAARPRRRASPSPPRPCPSAASAGG